MSIYAKLKIEAKAHNGQVVKEHQIQIVIDEGHNQGAIAYLDQKEARDFLSDLTVLLDQVPYERDGEK